VRCQLPRCFVFVFMKRGFSEHGELFYGIYHGEKFVEHRRRGKEYIVNEAKFVAINNLCFNKVRCF